MVLCRCFHKRRHKNREENDGLGKISMSVLKTSYRNQNTFNLSKPSFYLHVKEEFISTALKHGGWVDSEDWREGLTARAAWQPDGYHRDWDRKQELAHLLLLFLLWLLFIPSVSPPSSTYVWEHRTQSTITARAEEEHSSEKLNNAR